MRMRSAGLLVLCLWTPAMADELRSTAVSGHVHMISGKGGNVGVSAGPDGVFLIDDQYAPGAPALLAAARAIRDAPLRFVINTHWHGDHTGGNEAAGDAGAIIMAHDNVRKRLNSEQFLEFFKSRSGPRPPAALPVITFTEQLSLHLNGDRIDVIHVAAAHTDGDSIIHFQQADVLHMGDVFFHGMYPFIDLSSGGSIDGLIRAVERGLALAGPQTRVIPGHGPLTDRAGLAGYHRFLVSLRDAVSAAIGRGESLEQIIAARPTAARDADWGGGFISAEQLVRFVHQSLARK